MRNLLFSPSKHTKNFVFYAAMALSANVQLWISQTRMNEPDVSWLESLFAAKKFVYPHMPKRNLSFVRFIWIKSSEDWIQNYQAYCSQHYNSVQFRHSQICWHWIKFTFDREYIILSNSWFENQLVEHCSMCGCHSTFAAASFDCRTSNADTTLPLDSELNFAWIWYELREKWLHLNR